MDHDPKAYLFDIQQACKDNMPTLQHEVEKILKT